VLCTKLRPPPDSHSHCVSLIFPAPTGSPWIQTHWLDQLPNSLGKPNFVRPGITQRDGNRHVRWELLRRPKALEAYTPKYRLSDDPQPSILAGIQDEVAWRTGFGGKGRSPGTPLWQLRSIACRGRWPAGSTCGGTTSGVSHSNPSITKTSRCERWPNWWWDFLLRLASGHLGGNRSLRLWESRSSCLHFENSVSTGGRSFGFRSYWDGWRGAEVLLSDPCQQTQVNQPLRGSRSHQGSQVRQGSGPKRYTEQGLEASFPASGIPSGPDLQCDSPHPSLPFLLEAGLGDLYP